MQTDVVSAVVSHTEAPAPPNGFPSFGHAGGSHTFVTAFSTAGAVHAVTVRSQRELVRFAEYVAGHCSVTPKTNASTPQPLFVHVDTP